MSEVEMGERETRDAVGALLSVAWRKYEALFGEPPHGTPVQLSAMLALTGLPKAALAGLLSVSVAAEPRDPTG